MISPRGIKMPGWHNLGDSYASWTGCNLPKDDVSIKVPVINTTLNMSEMSNKKS